MATINKNMEIWNDKEHWKHGTRGNGVGLADGEKWSHGWGGSENQWRTSLYPRVSEFLPATTVLELAPGYGRWTQYLLDYCDKLKVVDLAPNCIERCKERFKDETRIEYYVNDGKTLTDIGDSSIDFLFCFDSLVHVDRPEIESYLNEFYRVLTGNGAVFFHHSNLLEYGGKIKSKVHLRSTSVSADEVAQMASTIGFRGITQECIPWSVDNMENEEYLDCMTTLRKAGDESRSKTYNKDWRDW